MKNLLTILFLSLNLTLSASGDIFISGSWEEIKAKAKKENKFILLDCYTDWCGWCKVMDKETFKDQAVVDELTANFICFKREMEKEEEGRLLALKFHVRYFPTQLFFSPDGKLISFDEGYSDGPGFLALLKKVKTAGAQNPFPGYTDKINPGFPGFLTTPTKKGGDKEAVRLQAIDFLDKQQNLFSESAWTVLCRVNVSVQKYDDWVFQNADTLRYLYGAHTVVAKISSLLYSQVKNAVDKKDPALFRDAIGKAEKFGGNDSRDLIFNLSRNYYAGIQDYPNLVKLIRALIDTSGYGPYASFILGTAVFVVEHSTDKDILDSTAVWMKNLCAVEHVTINFQIYAEILYRLERYDEAEIQAEKAMDLCLKNKEDTAATEVLLANIRLKKNSRKKH